MTSKKPDVCCPEFNPPQYDKKTLFWKNKPFVRADVFQIMHIPVNMGAVVTKTWKMIEGAEAAPKAKDFLMLAYDPSPWKSELYFTVKSAIKGAKNIKLSGEFYCKVFDGPYQDVPKWMAEMEKWAVTKKKIIEKQYFFYTYCPKCSQKYGHNYCVAFAKIKN